jgi:hypothetical protein
MLLILQYRTVLKPPPMPPIINQSALAAVFDADGSIIPPTDARNKMLSKFYIYPKRYNNFKSFLILKSGVAK